jgi:hypothetical protein
VFALLSLVGQTKTSPAAGVIHRSTLLLQVQVPG